MSKIKVYCAWMSTGLREDIHLYLLRDLQERYGDKIELVFPDNCCWRFPHDHARNGHTNEFLESECDVLWFLDSDVCPPKFILDLIANTKTFESWQIAGAPYGLWMPLVPGEQNRVVFTTYDGTVRDKDGNATGIHMTECPAEGQAFVDGIATGCMFIKREVFEKLEKPYFEFKFHPVTRNVIEGEDLGFCLKANKLGIKCLIDYSMVCKHYKRVDLLDVSNYAMDFAKNKIKEYDLVMREQFHIAAKEAIDLAYKRGIEKGRAEAGQPAPKKNSGLILPANY